MTFEPKQPEEARGDQFETSSPVQVEVVDVEEKNVTFDYGIIELQSEETPLEETVAVTQPAVPFLNVVTDSMDDREKLESVRTPDPVDKTVLTTDTHRASFVSSTTPSEPISSRTTPTVTSAASVHSGPVGSASCGEDGSACDAPPTPAGDSQSAMKTDEAEIGGTELPTHTVTASIETTVKTQTADFEGSASGEDETSGQDPYEITVVTSTVPPKLSILYTQQSKTDSGSDVTEVPMVLPALDTNTETGSGDEQPSGEEEGEESGDHVDQGEIKGEAAMTASPAVAALRPTASTPHTFHTLKDEDDEKTQAVEQHSETTTSDDHALHLTPPQRVQTVQPVVTFPQYLNQPSTTMTPSYTSQQNILSIPHWALTPDPAATPLPEVDYVDYDKEIAPPLVESVPRLPDHIFATEQPEVSTDSLLSVEASSVDVSGRHLLF